MSHKIQITVDEQLNNTIKTMAQQTGLSVSSYVRLVLVKMLPKQTSSLFEQAMNDVHSGNTESLTLVEFNKQIDELL